MNSEPVSTLYRVSFNDFYDWSDRRSVTSRRLCEKAIKQLIKRYNLKGMDVLSIGPGGGHEEYWFGIKGGNRLTFFDIDEHGEIESELKKMANLPHVDNTNKVIDYYIGDFTKCGLAISKKFDLLYLSGFTPNEVRRAHGPIRIIRRLLKFKIFRAINLFAIMREPFHNSMYKAFSMAKPNGLIIIQSYYGGIDVISRKSYVEAINRAFAKANIILLDFFCFESEPGVQLIVGFAGGKKQALEFYKNIVASITTFHGRAKLEGKIKHVYSLISAAGR